MLVLSRKKNEVAEIQDMDGNIIAEVVVVEIRGDKVRLGINAAKNLPVHRKEVADAIRRYQLPRSQQGSPNGDSTNNG